MMIFSALCLCVYNQEILVRLCRGWLDYSLGSYNYKSHVDKFPESQQAAFAILNLELNPPNWIYLISERALEKKSSSQSVGCRINPVYRLPKRTHKWSENSDNNGQDNENLKLCELNAWNHRKSPTFCKWAARSSKANCAIYFGVPCQEALLMAW